MMNWLKHLVVAVLLSAACNAQAILTIKITQGNVKALPIAIVAFRSAGQMPVDIAEVVAADLARSGRFAPMASQDMPARPAEFSEVDFQDWKLLGMENLVVGKITPTPGGEYEVEFRLIDVFKADQITGFKITSTAGNLRLTAHQVADLVYEELTGERGAFATRIAYVTVRKQAGDEKIYTLQIADADGYNPQTLLESPQPVMSPAWSPDGAKLAYVSFEGRNSAIYVQDVFTGSRKAVASGQGINSAPAWSPDGTKLALTRSKEGNPEIYVLYVATGLFQRLTDDPSIDTEPAWSPDGSRIAFTSDRGGGPQIYEVELASPTPRRITFSQGDYNARPRYSPDGRMLAMVNGGSGGYHIAVLNLRDGDFRVLTGSRLDESPSFAPNGGMIIYATVGAGGTELAATSIDGRVQQRLALQEGEVREPAWGPFRK